MPVRFFARSTRWRRNPLGAPALLDIAARLGADVPFLTSESAFALGWGRGERLLALSVPPEREVLLLLPAFGVDTARAYGWLADTRASGAASAASAALLETHAMSSWDALASLASNDFEPVVAKRHPQIATLVAQLGAAGCAIAMMSGSGSSVFGVLPATWAVDLPRLVLDEDGLAPRVLLTRTATRVEPVIATE